jgi:hypothetical protein
MYVCYSTCFHYCCRLQDADIFMSACMSGDEHEVDELLRKGSTTVDTAALDGLTALHQVCVLLLLQSFFRLIISYIIMP